MVKGWLKVDAKPLEMTLGQQIVDVETFFDANRQPIYYVVYLQPSGFVIVPADDLVEPIIAFADDGIYDPSPDNPLGALVSRDLPGRVVAVRGLQAVSSGQPREKDLTRQQIALKRTSVDAQGKWAELQDYADMMQVLGLSGISNVWVAPLVQSKWSQSTESGLSCYNYYTPPYAPNTPANYPCGCVATALAQLMRFHEHPTVGIGMHSFLIWIDGDQESVWTRGGDGEGGAYDWAQMMLDPNSSITGTQRQAIGNLCYDAGISVNMQYTGSGSGADTLKTRDALVSTFGYGNAIKGYNAGNNIGEALNGMVNPNLDYGCPAILGVTGTSGGHAIIADGYGYDFSTLYHHLNMGWAGSDDAWYNLPNIDSSPPFTSVYKCVYNVFVSGSGEVISGRVTDMSGDPISGATVTAQGSGGPFTASTNINGIYALAKVPSSTTFTVSVSKNGYTFEPPEIVTTGTSGGSISGNRWGIDFQGISGAYPVIQLSAEEMEFAALEGGSNPEPQILSICNSGFGTLNWVIDYDCNWLEVDPCEGISTGDINEVTLCVDTTGMALGSYNCKLTISDPCAFNSPTTVEVNLAIWDVLLVPTEAYPTIQAAIDAAADGCIIIVSEGIHTGHGNRDIDFKGLAITVRSEDGPENCIIDCQASSSKMHRGFYFHSGEGESSILDGFTITNGYALNDEGGGIYCVGASPTITNCIISGCTAGNIGSGLYNYGGGMSNKDGSSPTLTNCTFSDNSAQYGGGMHNRFSNPTLINCTFTNNSAKYAGAMYNYESDSTVTNCAFNENLAYYAGAIYVSAGSSLNLTDCTFRANRGDSQGGAVYNKGIAALTNCTFSGNSAGYRAGAMHDRGQSTLTKCIFVGNSATSSNGSGGGMSGFTSNSALANCLFVANSAPFYGGGLFSDKSTINLANCTFAKNSVGRNGRAVGCFSTAHSNLQVTNCILWDGGDEVWNGDGSTITITYSDVKGGWPGEENIDADPCFVSGPAGDYYLSQTAAGQAVDSPCVDAGSDTAAYLGMDIYTTRTDQYGDKGIVDMGYHYPPTILIGEPDINYDFYVDLFDFGILAIDWLLCSDPCDSNGLPGDIMIDGCVDINDLAVLSDYWLDCRVVQAGNPSPADNESLVDPNGVLSWSAGDGAVSHDVYFGTDYNDVNEADTNDPNFYMGNQEPNSWDPNNYDPCGLDLETTYYWRINEVGARCVKKGKVWNFTTIGEPNFYLVGWWKFDEGSGTDANDSSGYGNDGTLYGDPNWVAGKIGSYALDFDGVGDYVQIPDDDSLTPNNKITIAYWLYNRGGQDAGIFKYASCPSESASPGASRAYHMTVIDSTGKLRLGIFDPGDNFDAIDSNSVVALNQWHHIAGTFDAGEAVVYIDGQLDNSATLSVSSIWNDAQPLIIGGYWEYCGTDSFVSKLNGKADEVRVYDRALTAGEIEQLYQSGLN